VDSFLVFIFMVDWNYLFAVNRAVVGLESNVLDSGQVQSRGSDSRSVFESFGQILDFCGIDLFFYILDALVSKVTPTKGHRFDGVKITEKPGEVAQRLPSWP
jgi:hypothetical protein